MTFSVHPEFDPDRLLADANLGEGQAESDLDLLREYIQAVEVDLAGALEELRSERKRSEELSDLGNRLASERQNLIGRAARLLKVKQDIEGAAQEALRAANERIADLEGRLGEKTAELLEARSEAAAATEAARAARLEVQPVLDEAADELSRCHEELAARNAMVGELSQELDTLRATVAQVSEERRKLAQELHEATRNLVYARCECGEKADLIARLESELRTARTALAAAGPGSPPEPAETAAAVRSESTSKAPAAATARAPEARPGAGAAPPVARGPAIAAAPPSCGEILVVDGDLCGEDTVRALNGRGCSAHLAPDRRAVQRVGVRRPVGAALNLAMPESWDVAAHARTLCLSPIFGYLQRLGSASGVWLGDVDFARSSEDGSVLFDRMRGLSARFKRVFAVSGDPAFVAGLRKSLEAARVSFFPIPEGSEPLRAAGALRPSVLVAHVSPRLPQLLGRVVALRRAEALRHCPILFVVDDGCACPAADWNGVVTGIPARAVAGPPELADALVSALEIHNLKALASGPV